ncbi:MAG TPA: DUF1266 domain-containing protein [Chthoniobacterales bacterium]
MRLSFLPKLVGFCLCVAFAVAGDERVSSDLFDAARTGDVVKLQTALDGGANINYQNPLGETALMNAADAGQTEALKVLIAKGADLNILSKRKRSALLLATLMKHEAAAMELLLAGADFSTPDVDGKTVWEQANRQKLLKLQLALRERGADLPQKKVATLFDVAADGDIEGAAAILKGGANINARTKSGNTPLIFAAINGRLEMVKFLVEAGADVNAQNREGDTALTRAGQRGKQEYVQYLAAHGAMKTEVLINPSPWPFEPLPMEKRWVLAASAILTQYNRDSHEILGGKPLSYRERERSMLRNWWKIANRADALQTLDWLLASGHRDIFAMLDDGQIEARLLASGLDRAAVNETFQWIRTAQDQRGFDRRSLFLAWDLCRCIHVARKAYVSGYLDEAEAWDRSMTAARLIQKRYDSWKDMGESYLLGRQLWSQGGDQMEQVRVVFQLLLNPKDANSPWNNIPWDTDLAGN